MFNWVRVRPIIPKYGLRRVGFGTDLDQSLGWDQNGLRKIVLNWVQVRPILPKYGLKWCGFELD